MKQLKCPKCGCQTVIAIINKTDEIFITIDDSGERQLDEEECSTSINNMYCVCEDCDHRTTDLNMFIVDVENITKE